MNATKAIFKTFFLSLCVIANIHFAFAQTTGGIIPNGQNVFLDNNGKPLSGGKVFFYTGNVGSTVPKTTFQDINLTTPNTNPVILDASGRPHSGTGLWGTGNYRQVVQDKLGNLIWDVLTSAAGSGSSGGGGTATGDGDLVGTIKPWAGMTAPNQYMFAYGAQISRTTFSALFTAITSAQSVFCNSGSPILNGLGDTTNFWIGMTVEVSCVPAGVSTVLSKTSNSITLNTNANVTLNTNATFFPWGNGNGINTFTLPDLRGVVPMGNNIMGGVASSNMSDVNFGPQGASSSGALGGSQSEALLPSNAPNVSNTFVGIQGTATSTGNFANGLNLSTSNAVSPGGGNSYATSETTATVNSTFTPTGTISSLAGGIAVSSTIVAAGSAYPVSSSVTLTVVGGTCSIAPQFTVSTSGGGALTSTPTLLTAGRCSVVPSNPVATTSSGTGTGGTLNVIYSAVPFSLVQPSKTINYIVKVTPDANSATANGVTDINGMTGSIGCGTGLTCTGNTISANSSVVNSINGETGNITLGNGLSIAANVLSAAVGVLTNTLNTQTTNYTIQTGDCGATIQAGTGATGQFTITLPSISGFNSKCQLNVYNADTSAGKILSGFPTSMTSPNLLWPLQNTTLSIVNGAWTATNPGRWKNPSQQTIHVDKTNGSNSNDGLASGAGRAVQDAQQAWSNAQYLFDTQGSTPIIAMACAQTHTVALSMGGTPLGTNLIQLSPDGNCSFTWTNAGPCIVIADLAELDLRINANGSSGSVTFGCNTSNTASTGAILLHNQVVLDVEGVVNWGPGGANDNWMFCDGPCEFTIANGVTQTTSATGNYLIYLSEGGKGTQSGTISATGSGSATGVYYVYSGLLVIGTINGTGWASLGQSKINGGATLVNNGITPAGGVSVDPGSLNCTSLTAACVSQTASTGVANAGSPTGNSTTAAKMMGIGSTCVITPLRSGKVIVSFNFTHTNAVITTDTLQVMRGTGTAPANGVASAGTAVGNSRLMFEPSGTSNMEHGLSYLVTGLTIGTAEWFDFALSSGSNTNLSAVSAVACSQPENPKWGGGAT